MRKSSKGKKAAEARAVDPKVEAEADAREDLELTDEEAADVAGGITEVITVNTGSGMSKNFYTP